MRNVRQLAQSFRERHARYRAIEAQMWRVFCGERKSWVCTGWIWVRFGIYLIIGAFAGLGLVLAMAPGVSIDAFALPFFVLWHRAPALLLLIAFGAFLACVYYVYARVGMRMAEDAWGNGASHVGNQK